MNRKAIIVASLLFMASQAWCMDYLYMLFPKNEQPTRTEQANDTIIEPVEETPVIKPRVAIVFIQPQVNFTESILDLIGIAKNKDILGVIFVIDNNGGPLAQYSALHDVMKKMSLIKPTVSLVAGNAYSCGYLIASAANYIIAHSCSGIGSIGLLHEVARYKNAKTKGQTEADLEVEIFQAGACKTLFNEFAKALTDEDRKYLQDNLTISYKQFLKLVAENRNLSLDNYTDWAEGKSFISCEALKRGLIDEIGTAFEAEKKIIELIRQKYPDFTFADEIEPLYKKESQPQPAAQQQ